MTKNRQWYDGGHYPWQELLRTNHKRPDGEKIPNWFDPKQTTDDQLYKQMEHLQRKLQKAYMPGTRVNQKIPEQYIRLLEGFQNQFNKRFKDSMERHAEEKLKFDPSAREEKPLERGVWIETEPNMDGYDNVVEAEWEAEAYVQKLKRSNQEGI